MKSFAKAIYSVIKESFTAWIELLKIMVPIIIAVKLIAELGLLPYLASALEPLMHLMGLPGIMGLVWATAMVNNIYSAMIVFVSLPESFELTVAQVTILSTAILMAHALPIELRIAQRAGTRLIFQGLFRIGCALILGIILNFIYEWGGWLQATNTVVWRPNPQPDGLLFWIFSQLKNLGVVFVIILILMAVIRFLDHIRATELFIWLLGPLFRLMGIGKEAASITIVGLTMGLAYGGALIIKEARTEKIKKQDIFFSLTLMGIAHSLIEDTLLMMLLGAHLSGILLIRLIFSVLIILLMVKVWSVLPDRFVHKYLYPLPEDNLNARNTASRPA
ncbi:hypothetical protein [Desulfonatronovibrio magnus]|uniref:hypothetical protein n=1 Tax=Desulfonatronovibrio magnus TaxID=698827 RepID=UPI0005EAC968|nr:hypothetical protein [Desulfonatronovibrio magnus]